MTNLHKLQLGGHGTLPIVMSVTGITTLNILYKTMTNTPSSKTKSARFENIITGLSRLGIGVYLLLHYALDVGHQVYTLSVNTALTSADTSLYLL